MNDTEKKLEQYLKGIDFDDAPDSTHRDLLEKKLLLNFTVSSSRQNINWRKIMSNEIEKDWTTKNAFWAHIGMYAFKADVLQRITKLEQGKLELAESLEQLRWLENGYKIKTAETITQSIGIDTPEDLEAALNLFN